MDEEKRKEIQLLIENNDEEESKLKKVNEADDSKLSERRALQPRKCHL